MIELRLSVDALGHAGFGYSPLSEAAASLRALSSPSGRELLGPWLRDVAGRLHRTDLALLQAVAPSGFLAPDFLFAWSRDPQVTIEDQLAEMVAVPPDVVARDVARVWDGNRRPASLDRLMAGDGLLELADAILRYWNAAIAPFWPQIRGAIDEDVALRGQQMIGGGVFAMLGDLHPELSLRGDTLLIDKPQHPDEVVTAPVLTLIPSVFVWPQLAIANSAEDRFELQYATSAIGRVWESQPAGDATNTAFALLAGRTRATILASLATPRSTTQLARDLATSPSSVSAHLAVLRRNGLISASRAGRSVLYERTSLAKSILAAGANRDQSRQPG